MLPNHYTRTTTAAVEAKLHPVTVGLKNGTVYHYNFNVWVDLCEDFAILNDVAVEKNWLLLLFRVGHYMEVSATVNMFRLVAGTHFHGPRSVEVIVNVYPFYLLEPLENCKASYDLYDVVIATSEVHRSPIRTKTMFSVIKVY